MSKEWLAHRIKAEEEGRRIGSVLQFCLGFSRRRLQVLTRTDGFRLNGKRAHLDRRVKEGDLLEVCVHQEEEGNLAPVAMDLKVLYEDADLLILDKPPGIEVHPPEQRARFRPTLAHGVAHYFAEKGIKARVRPLHRLDKDTTGICVFAKNAYAHQTLDRQLRDGTLQRGYLALLRGLPADPVGIIDEPIGRDPEHHMRRMVRDDGERAITRYRVVEVFEPPCRETEGRAGGTAELEPSLEPPLALAEVVLETGRTHQIRVHFSHRGTPLLGDRLYGGDSPRIGRQALHSAWVTLRQPRSGEAVKVTSDLPEDMACLIVGNEESHGGNNGTIAKAPETE
ncbi:RluA family pseudouridine synthase [Heliobacterium gestii]|uniref:RNA pseudouridylate synthase n=1 Tax=Heliomicrobium gestii TaxID=2699 RepID=A0A845LFY3_HELGE|nr:RluA family pseudouridine synthase [Heliomicrobium gestii]MBM7867843.1 RluA family pseudouridine synthase [Heliomicrobium gestii]MZP43345.1 RluA family pseudouridine synthase [Heliomicrobium gestii]